MSIYKYEWFGEPNQRNYLMDREVGAFIGRRSGFLANEVVVLYVIPRRLIQKLEKPLEHKVRSVSDIEEVENEHKFKQHTRNDTRLSLSSPRYVKFSRSDMNVSDVDFSFQSGDLFGIVYRVNGVNPKNEDRLEQLIRDVSRARVRIENRYLNW